MSGTDRISFSVSEYSEIIIVRLMAKLSSALFQFLDFEFEFFNFPDKIHLP